MGKERAQGVPTESRQEIHFACTSAMWNEIADRLRAHAPNEACVLVLTRPSRGTLRTTAILREPIWPLVDEVQATPYSLEISADYISRAVDTAIEDGELTGLTLIHTHPNTKHGKGEAFFSARDDWYEQRLFPTITRGREKAISGSIVLGSAPFDVDARVWWTEEKKVFVQPAQIIRIVGPNIKFVETKHSSWNDHLDPDMMDRSTRLWGAEGRRILQNLRVGIVGAGGTGSIVLLSTATMGVGKIRVWDDDAVKKENLHRMVGATKAMIGDNKAKALAEFARAVATASPSQIEDFPKRGTTEEALNQLKDCDLVFSCVDKLAPRVPLNDLAYAHLIPTVDMASWIHPADDGRVDAIVAHAHVWSPGIPCAWCRQTLTSLGLMREAQGNQRNIENRYGLPLLQTDGVEPSVLPLNLAGVGLAMMQFMQIALGITKRTPRDLKLFLPDWELDESDLDTTSDCVTEANTASGDAARINPA